MITSYVVEVDGEDAGIIAREAGRPSFRFFSASERFRSLDLAEFSGYREAERAAREVVARRRKRMSTTKSF